MNLHSIVSPYIATVNPMVTVSVQRSTGYTTAGDGTRTPSFATPVTMLGQIQALQYNDLQQISGLNLNGERRAIYLNGNWDGVSRPDNRGGDIITFPDGSKWMVAVVLENWSSTDGWVKVAATRQMP